VLIPKTTLIVEGMQTVVNETLMLFQHSKIVESSTGAHSGSSTERNMERDSSELIIFHSVVRNERGQCIYNSQRGVFIYNQQLRYLLELSFHHGCKTLPLGQGYFARKSKF